jgi:hypothetical protein
MTASRAPSAAAFGAGELNRLLNAYHRLCVNVIEHNDTAIDLIGFSRGAATCLDFCNMIEDWQIKDPRKLGAEWRLDSYLTAPKVADAPPLRFVGLFDVVGAFGVGAIAGDLPEFQPRSQAAVARITCAPTAFTRWRSTKSVRRSM